MAIQPTNLRDMAAKKQKAVIAEADQWVQNAAQSSKGAKPSYVPSERDQKLAKAFLEENQANQPHIDSANHFLQSAAWLGESLGLADVLIERGVLTKQEVAKLLGETIKPAAPNANTLWADMAIRMGYITLDLAKARLQQLDPEEKKLTLASMLVREGVLTREEDESVRYALRAKLGKKPKSA